METRILLPSMGRTGLNLNTTEVPSSFLHHTEDRSHPPGCATPTYAIQSTASSLSSSFTDGQIFCALCRDLQAENMGFLASGAPIASICFLCLSMGHNTQNTSCHKFLIFENANMGAGRIRCTGTSSSLPLRRSMYAYLL